MKKKFLRKLAKLLMRLIPRRREKYSSRGFEKFKSVFLNIAKKDEQGWREYIGSDIFLNEQYNIEFVEAVDTFLKKQIVYKYNDLPKELVVELAVAYALYPRKEIYEVEIGEDEKNSGVKNIIAEIWNSQENIDENYVEFNRNSMYMRKLAYHYYESLRTVAISGNWDAKSKYANIKEYVFALAMGAREALVNDDIDNKEFRDVTIEDDYVHEQIIMLFDYLVRKYPFSKEACAYMYNNYRLDSINNEYELRVYGKLQCDIIKQYPDIEAYGKQNISVELYSDKLRDEMKKIKAEYGSLGWGKNFKDVSELGYATHYAGWCKEEEEKVRELLNDPLFEKYKFSENVIMLFKVLDPSFTQAKILAETYLGTPESYENPQVIHLIHELNARISMYEKQKECIIGSEPEYSMKVGCHEFWLYYLEAAYGDRSMEVGDEAPIAWVHVSGKKMTLTKYVEFTFAPSREWRMRFTNYDKEKGRFGKPRQISIKLGKKTKLQIEFHYRYVRYFILSLSQTGEYIKKELLHQKFNVKELLPLLEGGKKELFLLLLPVAYIEKTEVEAVYEKLIGVLADVIKIESHFLPFLATMIVNNNASVYEIGNKTELHYIENLTDAYRLDIDNTGEKYLYHFNEYYGNWEACIDGYCEDTSSFEMSSLMLDYEVEKAFHDVGNLSAQEKYQKLFELMMRNNGVSDFEGGKLFRENQFILVFSDKNRIACRNHIYTGGMFDEKMTAAAYADHSFLDLRDEHLAFNMKEECRWKAWVSVDRMFKDIPIACGLSGKYYANDVTYGEGICADSLTGLFERMFCADDLTGIIEYNIEKRSEWDNEFMCEI